MFVSKKFDQLVTAKVDYNMTKLFIYFLGFVGRLRNSESTQ